PPAAWAALGQKDAEDPRLDYEALRRGVGPHVAAELTPEKWQARYAACQAGARTLASLLDRVDPDAIVLITNPHRVWPQDYQPVFGIYRGASVPVVERRPARPPSHLPQSLQPESPRVAPTAVQADAYPAWPELAGHLIEGRDADGGDVV